MWLQLTWDHRSDPFSSFLPILPKMGGQRRRGGGRNEQITKQCYCRRDVAESCRHLFFCKRNIVHVAVVDMGSLKPSLLPLPPKLVGVNAGEEEEVGKSRQTNCVQESVFRRFPRLSSGELSPSPKTSSHFKKILFQQRSLGLRLEFLANRPASVDWSTWVALVYQEPSNRHHEFSSLLRFGSRSLVVDMDLFRPSDFIELALLTRSAGSTAP